MASIVLSGLGSAVGGGLFSSGIAPAIGGVIGGTVGDAVDSMYLSRDTKQESYNHRIKEVTIQNASYGSVIPIVYGSIKLAGNIIWADRIKEHQENTTQVVSKRQRLVRTKYNYTISIAIAIAKGTITSLDRIWADDVLLDRGSSNIRFYSGSEDQMPDPLIERVLGVGKAPAYRGLSYVVFEDFDVSGFHNRIPQFTFEVRRSLLHDDSVESSVSAINIIPGGGEFVYDTDVQSKIAGSYVYDKEGSKASFIPNGYEEKINSHNSENKANSVVSIDQLKATLPNVKWVAPVVSWFANSIDGSSAVIEPGVEFVEGYEVTSSPWRVGGYDRKSACNILMKEGRPIYGGTTDDAAVVRYLKHLRAQGYKIMFYPMFFVNQHDKPWRGRLKCDAKNIHHFFNKKQGYNDFIKHYARLTKGLVDAFLIGSELIGLTSVYGEDSNTRKRIYPAVDELIRLANDVRKIMGKSVKISYAADWSEYHHTDGGWYHMDPLWASDNIDFVGIDAYFPLTEFKQTSYDFKKIMDGWASGEHYDYVYSNDDRNIKREIKPEFAIKNIEWWWSNRHYNPDGSRTRWNPASKPIWFTEYGFPSVDLATNQPNVFYDGESVESGFPRYSDGKLDMHIQRLAIWATEKYWANSKMVQNKFLWTWDARPYPLWPDRKDVWIDSPCWYKGHWVQGKLGVVSLGDMVTDLFSHSELAQDKIDVSQLHQTIAGFVINKRSSIKSIIDNLQRAYFFTVTEKGYKIVCHNKEEGKVHRINYQELIPYEEGGNFAGDGVQNTLYVHKIQETDLPKTVSINFINRSAGYEVSNQYASRTATISKKQQSYNIPLVLDNIAANTIANKILYYAWSERHYYSFIVSYKYLSFDVGDLVVLKAEDREYMMKIISIEFGKNYQIKVRAVAYNDTMNNYLKVPKYSYSEDSVIDYSVDDGAVELIDVPILCPNGYPNVIGVEPQEEKEMYSMLFVLCYGKGPKWRGCALTCAVNNNDYAAVIEKSSVSNAGVTSSSLGEANNNLIDCINTIEVSMVNCVLSSISNDEMMSGKNMMLIGNELIQFQNARIIQNQRYKLSKLLRGLNGTAMTKHAIGERVVFIDMNDLYAMYVHNTHVGSDVRVTYHGLNDSGQVVEDMQQQNYKVKFTGRYGKPLPVTHAAVRRLGVDAEQRLGISWQIRKYTHQRGSVYIRLEFCDGDNKVVSTIEVENSNHYVASRKIEREAHYVVIQPFNYSYGDGDKQRIRLLAR